MTNADHYAVVVGVSRYPTLGELPDTPADLKGPENDADAVCAWLKSAGGLPDSNVKLVKSSIFAPFNPATAGKPTTVEIEECFLWLEQLARTNQANKKGLKVGRRLYVYVSGHGFSPKRNQGCLFAANARPRYGVTSNVSRWLEWFQDANYFDEFVLWMDCCMNRMSLLPPGDVPFPPISNPDPAGPAFIAFAAQRPLKAAESSIREDEDRVHGIFTWILLDGLQGAAVDEYGMVTSRSLADWLRNALRPRMSLADVNDPDVAKEPEILKEDPGIVFARGLAPKSYKTVLSFPPTATGQQARLWSGRPPRINQSFTIQPNVELSLASGLYVLDAPSVGLRQGLEVTGTGVAAVSSTGAPVNGKTGEIFSLEVSPAEAAMELFVLDERFGLIYRNSGSLQLRLPFGIYKVKARLSRSIKEEVFLLDQDRPTLEAIANVPVMTAAPLPNTAASHEYHQVAATRGLATVDVRKGTGAAITVMARIWSSEGQQPTGLQPWLGVKVVNENGRVIADLERDGRRDGQGDPSAVCSLSVTPGTYYLRHVLQNGQEAEQALIVPTNWSLRAFLLRIVEPGGRSLSPYPRLSLMMHPLGNIFSLDDPQRKTMEAARVALADERAILNRDLEALLLRKFKDPLAGIIGGHLLLIEHERDPTRDISLLDLVVNNLRSLVGSEHPDVECLSLRCPDESLRRTKALRTPPLYQRSWMLLIEACQRNPSLVPKKLWDRVQAQSTLPPYLIWAPDADTKASSREAVVDALIDVTVSALAVTRPNEISTANAALQVTRSGATIPKGSDVKDLAKTIIGAVSRGAARLDVPPSALKSLNKDVASKFKE
jgi:hypothetical protein